MADLQITTKDTILFSSTDVFFVSLKKNIPDDREILVWFDDTEPSVPEYWNIERHYKCEDFTEEGNAFIIYAPNSKDIVREVSLAISLRQGVVLPKSTSLKIYCRINKAGNPILTTTIYYQSTYNPYSESDDIYSINPNYNLPIYTDGTKQLLRTNPKLTGNIKITIDSNQDIWLNTIDANIDLSSNRFKKFKLSKDGSYAYDVRKLLDNGRLDSKTLFTLNNKDETSVKTNIAEQYNTFYWSGCEYFPSLMYNEEFSCFAPLWIDKTIPDYFVIFSSSSLVSDNLKSDVENFKDSIIKNSRIVKVFSLKENTNIGTYLRSILNSNVYSSSPIKVNFENLKSISYRGIDFQNGIYTEKNELIDDFIEEDNPILHFEERIIQGFERNNLICYNLLNLEFLFNDNDSYEYDIRRYFGFYVNENELSKFTIDEEAFYQNYTDIPRNKVKVDNQSDFDIFDNDGISIAASLEGDVKVPSSELVKESERIFYIKGKYNLYKINDTLIDEIKGNNFFSRSFANLKTSQNYLQFSDITGFSSPKFVAKSEIKNDYGFPFEISIKNKLNDSDSISIIYQKGNIQKEWRVIGNSYAVGVGKTLEEEIIRESANVNLALPLKSFDNYSGFNVGLFEIPELLDFEIGSYIQLEYNNKIISASNSISESVSLTNGLNTFTVSSTNNLIVKQFVSGTGIPSGTIISSIDTTTNTITISNNANQTITSNITFSAYIAVKGDYTTYVENGEVINIINMNDKSSFEATLNFTPQINSSNNTIINLQTNSNLNNVNSNISNYAVNLDYTINPSLLKERRCEVSHIEKNNGTFTTFLYVKDNSKTIINNSNFSDNIIFTLRYTNDFIYNYFNPNGSPSQYLDSIISAFNTFDYKKFTITKKDSGLLIRSNFEPDAVYKVKIDLSNNHTEISDISIHNISSNGYLYKYESNVPKYKKIVLYEYQYYSKRNSILIPSDFKNNILGDEWIKTPNGNKKLQSYSLDSKIFFYLNNESTSFIEIELQDSAIPEIDKESNVIFYNLHKNSLGVMSFIPIADFDMDYLDSDYSYVPSEELKLNFYRFKENEKIPINQIYRIFTEYRVNNSTTINLFAVLSNGEEIEVDSKIITTDASTNFISMHTIPALYNDTIGNIEVSHFYFNYTETISSIEKPYFQNSKGFRLMTNNSFQRNMFVSSANFNITFINGDVSGLSVGLYVKGNGIPSGSRIKFISTTSTPNYFTIDKVATILNINTLLTFSLYGEIDTFTQEFNVNLFEGFNGINDFLDETETSLLEQLKNNNNPERFSFNLLRSEYDRLRENFNKNLCNKSRNIAYINKWVIPNSSDVRSNEYRLNTNLAFGVRNFSPDNIIELPSSLLLHTHEWYYINGMPFWYSENAAISDRNYTFSNVNDADLYNVNYDGFSRLFIRGSHKERYKSQVLNSEFRNLFTHIKYDKVLDKSFVFFKGTRFELNVTNPLFYNDWRFTSVLKPIIRKPFESDKNYNIRLVENRKWKTLTFIVEIFVQSYEFPNSEMNLIGLYTTDSSKNISIDSDSKFVFTPFDLQLTSSLNPTYLYTNKDENNDLITFNTSDDLSNQITINSSGVFSDIRVFGFGKRTGVYSDSKYINLQIYGKFLNSLTSTSIKYNYNQTDVFPTINDAIAYEFLGLSNYQTLNDNPNERYTNPPIHEDSNLGVSYSFNKSSAYYLKNDAGSLKEIIKKVSFASLLKTINNRNYTHIIIDENGNKTENYNYKLFGLQYQNPSKISKQALLQPDVDRDIPTEFTTNNVIGYNIVKSDYDFEIIRYGGDYVPKTRNILPFYMGESLTFLEEFYDSKKPNTRFNFNNSNFAKILNLGYHKVSDKKILTLADTTYTSDYPLLDETGIDYKDFSVISSTWDYNFYQFYDRKDASTPINPLVEAEEIKSFFGSKLINTPNFLTLEDFTFSDSKDISKDFWYELNNNEIMIHIFPANMILKCLNIDFLKNNILSSINPLRNNDLYTDKFFEEYIQLNLLKIYKISSVKLFTRGDRETQDIFINTNPITRNELGFREEIGVNLDTRIEDVLIKKNIDNLANAQLTMSIAFEKI
jgi:hypothetical protein